MPGVEPCDFAEVSRVKNKTFQLSQVQKGLASSCEGFVLKCTVKLFKAHLGKNKLEEDV